MDIKPVQAFFLLIIILLISNCSSQPVNQAEAVLNNMKQPEGWKRNSEIRTYTAADLWEYINGAAEQFIVYGVRDVATTDFITDEGAELTVDVYQMKDPLNAFGVYSLERNTAGPFPAVGGEACWNGTSLYFYTGEFYVKMIAFDEDDALKPAVQKLAEEIAASTPGESLLPRELAVFPPENLIAKSEKYFPANVLAQPFFSNGYTAQYKIEGEDVQAFVIFAGSPGEAKKSFDAYRASLDDGQRTFADAETGDESFATTDLFYGKIIASHSGSVIAGIMGRIQEKTAIGIAQKLLTNAAGVAQFAAR